MGVFDKFKDKVDQTQLEKDIQAARENMGAYEEVPPGKYIVEVEKFECKETKNGDPMVSIWYNIIEGKHKGCKLFDNRVIKFDSPKRGAMIALLMDAICDLDTGIVVEDKADLSTYEPWLEEVKDFIDDHGLEYELQYGKNNSGYNTFKILQVFEG